MNHAKIMFFLGKGGVGKTSCSVATALNLADKGLNVLLVSLDPAHNAGDALQMPLSNEKKAVTPNLDAMEIDLEKVMECYLDRSAKSMKHSYRYLRAINLDSLFDLVRCSPGIEEYATLEALNEIIAHDAGHYNVIVFDTAPTGLTLRVLALPSISLRWIEKLTDMRKRILRLRSSVEHIHGKQVFKIDGIHEPLASNEADDKTMQELLGYRSEIQHAHNILSNPELTSVVAVLNPEDMPLFETQRAADTLAKFQIPLNTIIINKVLRLTQIPSELERKIEKQDELIARIHREFSEQRIFEESWQAEEPCGLENLRSFCAASANFFYKDFQARARVDINTKNLRKDSLDTTPSRLGAFWKRVLKTVCPRKFGFKEKLDELII